MSSLTVNQISLAITGLTEVERSLCCFSSSKENASLEELRQALTELKSMKISLEESVQKVSTSVFKFAQKISDPEYNQLKKDDKGLSLFHGAMVEYTKATLQQGISLSRKLADLNTTIEKIKQIIAKFEMANQE